MTWPWQEFSWGVFWALLAAAATVGCIGVALGFVVGIVKEVLTRRPIQEQWEAEPAYQLKLARKQLESIQETLDDIAYADEEDLTKFTERLERRERRESR
jgi:hypothetical protein